MSAKSPQAVVIGASAGAIEALFLLLPLLPENYPLPILIVVHLPPDKDSVMAELFQTKCKLRVKEAEDKENLQSGTVYFAPANYHLLVETGHFVSLSNEEPVLFSRPSIDVLFETAADAYGPDLIGIILSGANNDGARGAKAIFDGGGTILVQTPALAYSAAMPQAALDACPGAKSLTMAQIADFLLTMDKR